MRILYIDIDSLRPDHLGCYGYHRNTSPNIDALASEGRRFTNYYVSDAPCLPSRTALSTSRFGIHTGLINHGGLNADVRPRGSSRNFATRWDDYYTWAQALNHEGYQTTLVSPFPKRHGAWHFLDGFDEWHDTGQLGLENADVVYDVAEDWLDDHVSEDEWFLHVNFWDPHGPYETPLEYGNPFEDDPAPDWPDSGTIQEHYESYGPHSAQDVHHQYFTGADLGETMRTPLEISDREDYEQWIDGYDVGIRYMDDHVGKIVDRLKAEGVYDETLIIVSADHGENQGELNVYGDHQTADEATCRVPLIVSGPGVEPGVDDDFHYQVDLAPTVTELAGRDPPAGWDGRSFAASVTEGEAVGRDYLVLSQGAWACQRAVRFEDWLLIRTYHDGLKDFEPLMLFDLAADPHETENLARERPEVVGEGLTLLDEWHDQRMMEVVLGENGGNPASPRSTADPMWEVLHEGGPAATIDNVESYARRLRETGREEFAEEIERREGYVEQDLSEYR